MKLIRSATLAAALALGFWPDSAAAFAPPDPPPGSVVAAAPVSLNATTGTANVALSDTSGVFPFITIGNVGTNEIFCQDGGVAVTASTSAYHVSVPGGAYRTIWSTNGYVACVTATSTATARITQSNGAAQLGSFGGGSSGGGGGAITGNVGILNTSATQIDPATAQRQDTGNTSLGTIATNTTGAATAANQTTANGSLSTIATNTTGAATAANQSTANGSLSTIATNTTGVSLATNQTAIQATPGSDATKAVAVQGVTGGKAVPVSAAALPLPVNAAQETGGNLATIAGAVTSSVVQSNTKQVNGVTTQAGAGAAGTGSQRVAVAQDATTVAGSAPGTAGTPSTNVLTVQGATSMTKLLVTPDSVALPANQSVNVAQLNGAAPSLTNPIYTANAEAADVSGTFTNGTQTNSVTNTSADGYAAGLISINGTYGTASGVFEASDDAGTTWYSIVCGRSDGTASETGYTALTNVSRQWSCPVGGNDSIRVRSTAVASGTANLRVGISAPPPSSTVTTGSVTVTQPTAASLNAQVVGAVASAGVNAGNPVKLGGVVATAQPSLSNGNINDVLMSSKGGVIITPQLGVAVTTGSVNVGVYDQAGNTRTIAVGPTLYNGSTNDAALSAVNGLNSTGTGIQDTANVDQFDDVSPMTITENQFGHVRMSTNRNQYGTIRDAAGNERGLNIDSHNSAQTVQYDSSGNPIDYTQNINVGPGPGGRVDVSCATGNVAAAIATCTMPATTGKTTYVAGFDISGSGATIGSVVTCTLTNTNSGTLSYTFAAAAGVLLADTPLSKSFAPPLKATAANIAPVLSCPSLGTGNTNMTINAYGYEL